MGAILSWRQGEIGILFGVSSPPALLSTRRRRLSYDYGQFCLHTAQNDPQVVAEVSRRAREGDGIAQSDTTVVVVSPHQNNFKMRLGIEVWSGEPDGDLDQWEEAFEVHLAVTDGVVFEDLAAGFTDLAVPAGDYHALITGRGFVALGWPGSTQPGDEWRIRLWPSDGPPQPRRLRQWTPPASATPEQAARLAEAEASGTAAAARIMAVVAAGTPLDDAGTATSTATLPGRPHKWAGALVAHGGWLAAAGGAWEPLLDTDITVWGVGSDEIVQRHWSIVCRFTVIERTRSQFTWVWRYNDYRGTVRLWPNTTPTVVDMSVQRMDDDHTRFAITHSRIPRSLQQDFADFWNWKLCELRSRKPSRLILTGLRR